MNEALPVGNGRLGGLVYGDAAAERIVLNEDSLWSGGENPSGAYNQPGPRDRQYTGAYFGSYEKLGELLISLPGHREVTGYRRQLDLGTARAGVEYQVGGATYRREVFVSNPDQVLVVRLTADRPGGYSGTIELRDGHGTATQGQGGQGPMFAGALANGRAYEAQLAVVNEGGTVATENGKVTFSACDGLTLVVGGGTGYAMDYAAGYRGPHPHSRVLGQVRAAAGKPYEAVAAAQVKDHRGLFDRVNLEVGASPAARRAMPTDRRKAAAAEGGDPEMEALVFQYGRYLLISSSRPGDLPANLQGLWADRNDPAWNSDYHANINVQMNYWGAEPANLAECHEPLFDLVKSQLEPWRKATQAEPEFRRADGGAARGWAIRTSHNIDGGLGWNWDKTANAWYCLHFWEHYAFGRDRAYLRDTAYPVLKEVCGFWEDQLKALPDGRLVVPNGWSPEHGPHEDGVSYNQEIVWDLFNNYVEASEALGVDAEYRAKVAGMRDRLVTPGVGSWGQLLEWMTEKHVAGGADAVLDTPEDHHRHTSHLFAVYPGRQISVAKTPALAAAAKVSLAARGNVGDVREWSYAWRAALWARLHDGDKALEQVRQFFTDKNSCPNLFGLHPPMQIDGDFGLSGAMPEMLVQSHEGEIHLLPALPTAWAAGAVRGLRARGGFEVDMSWKEGRLVAATLRGQVGAVAQVRYGGRWWR
jgi:alpha-L-fucosidase 2